MRLSILTRVVVVAAVATAFATPAPAHAQFGKLLKKAKEKVTGGSDSAAVGGATGTASSGSLTPGSPKFDATVIELTPSVVDQMLRGMAAEARVAQSSAARSEKLNADLAALEKEVEQLEAQHPSSERDAWQEANYKINECIGDELQKHEEQNEGEIQARLMSDPGARQKMMELTQRANAEAQRGDTLAAKKTMAEAQAILYPSAGADSAAAMKKCGKPSPKPAWMAHEDELNDRRSKITDAMRDNSSAARDTALYVAGQGGGGRQLTAIQYSMALERMIAWAAITGSGKGNGKASYSRIELDALKARDADVRKATADLRAVNVWR